MQHVIRRIPGSLEDTLNILDVFLTSNPSAYIVILSSSLGSSCYNLMFVCVLSCRLVSGVLPLPVRGT